MLHCFFHKGTWQKLSHGLSSHEGGLYIRHKDHQDIEVEDELGSDRSNDELCLEGQIDLKFRNEVLQYRGLIRKSRQKTEEGGE